MKVEIIFAGEDIFKSCSKCGELKRYSNFSFRVDVNLYRHICKECLSFHNKTYKSLNKEKNKTITFFMIFNFSK